MPKNTLHLIVALLGLIGVVVLGTFVGMATYSQFRQPALDSIPSPLPAREAAIISGSIQYNGIRPLPGDEALGRVVLYQRELGEGQFAQIPISVPLVSAATWSWSDAEHGKTYEIQASIEFQGREIALSNTVVVTAPAGGEQLIFNVSEDQVPEGVLFMSQSDHDHDALAEHIPTPGLTPIEGAQPWNTTPQPTPTPTPLPVPSATALPVAISGRVNLSGYIPANARLQLRAAPESSEAFDIVTTDIEVKDTAVWIWSAAEPGKRYRLRLELIQGDVIIGRSEDVLVAAPATNQYIQLASTAKPTVQVAQSSRASITGQIDLNGPVANNSSILILQRKPGAVSYTSVARIPAADGQTWSFDDAVTGEQYEMTAAFQVNGNNTSSANAVSLTAPASNITFRINTNVSLDAPGKPRVLTCGTRKSNGKWPTEVLFDQVGNANSYWFQIGTTAGSNNTYNERRNRTKENEEKVIIELEHNKEYFVRYAQAQCSDCRSDQDFSGFSESLSLRCGNE